MRSSTIGLNLCTVNNSTAVRHMQTSTSILMHNFRWRFVQVLKLWISPEKQGKEW